MKNIGDIKNKNIDALLNSKNIYYEGGGKTLNNIIYPIGSVVIRVDSQNPSYWYGGTWELLCPGRTMVCVDTNDSDFNVVKKTGGSKYLQKHSHGIPQAHPWNNKTSNHWSLLRTQTEYVTEYNVDTGDTGSGNSGNLQPYMVVYIWVRTK